VWDGGHEEGGEAGGEELEVLFLLFLLCWQQLLKCHTKATLSEKLQRVQKPQPICLATQGASKHCFQASG